MTAFSVRDLAENVPLMRFVAGPFLVLLGTYVAIRPHGYALGIARWIERVAPSTRFLSADGNPASYISFARAGGLFFVFGGVMILLHGV